MDIPNEVLTATNGKNYKVTGDGKVRQINYSKDFVPNDTDDYLDESVESNNTKILYKFLKQELDDEVTLSRSGYVKWRGFKFYYSSHGFRIEDTLNFGEVLNVNEFNNDFSYPKDVLEWLKKNQNRKIKPPEEDQEKARIANKLSSKFKVVVKNLKDEKNREDVLKDEVESKDKIVQTAKETRLNNAVSKFKEAYKNKATISELQTLAKKISQRKDFLKEVKNLLFQVKRDKISGHKFHAAFKKLIDPLYAPKTPEPKKAPKFHGLEILWEAVDLNFISNDKITFKLKDPSGKKFTMTVHPALYLVNVVLYYFPKAMPLVMKVANDENFDYLDINLSGSFIKDPFVEYNKKIIDTSGNMSGLYECCLEILWENEIPNPLEFMFSDEFKKGDNVKVFWPDYCTWFYGEVLSIDTGVKVRYENGEVRTVMNHNKIKKL